MTRYTYERGRLVASTPDVEWDEQEQAWMLALRMYRESRCPGCGGDLAVTTAGENEERFRAEAPLECYRCVAFARSHQQHADQPHPQALIHLVQPRPVRR